MSAAIKNAACNPERPASSQSQKLANLPFPHVVKKLTQVRSECILAVSFCLSRSSELMGICTIWRRGMMVARSSPSEEHCKMQSLTTTETYIHWSCWKAGEQNVSLRAGRGVQA